MCAASGAAKSLAGSLATLNFELNGVGVNFYRARELVNFYRARELGIRTKCCGRLLRTHAHVGPGRGRHLGLA